MLKTYIYFVYSGDNSDLRPSFEISLYFGLLVITFIFVPIGGIEPLPVHPYERRLPPGVIGINGFEQSNKTTSELLYLLRL
jgi:hypothetical protein